MSRSGSADVYEETPSPVSAGTLDAPNLARGARTCVRITCARHEQAFAPAANRTGTRFKPYGFRAVHTGVTAPGPIGIPAPVRASSGRPSGAAPYPVRASRRRAARAGRCSGRSRPAGPMCGYRAAPHTAGPSSRLQRCAALHAAPLGSLTRDRHRYRAPVARDSGPVPGPSSVTSGPGYAVSRRRCGARARTGAAYPVLQLAAREARLHAAGP